MIKVVGRDRTCDYIILDPERRVSRIHLQIEKVGDDYYLEDFSSNGTSIDGKPLVKGMRTKVTIRNNVVLGSGYVLNLQKVFTPNQSQHAHNMNSQKTDGVNQKNLAVDLNRTTIGDLLDIETSGYTTIGRSSKNKIVLANHSRISSEHCKIRQIGDELIEVVDLNSTNGTYIDGKILTPQKPGVFTNNATISLAGEFTLDLSKIFPGIRLVAKKMPPKNFQQLNNKGNSKLSEKASSEELSAFMGLEKIYDEFDLRNKSIGQEGASFAMAGQVAGIVAGAAISVMAPPMIPLGLLFTGGGAVLGKYIGSKKTNEIRTDLSYEKAFLEVYCCPRCGESFQKKPWVTIRDCNKCKVVFR
jgi:pSer/pThr/pTyr-binding forkhead associated (FHA) protein